MLAAPQPAEGVEGPTKTTASEPSQAVPAEAAPAPQPKSQPPKADPSQAPSAPATMLAAPQPAEGVEGPTKTTPSEPSQVVPAEAAPAPQPKSQPPNKAAAASAGSSDKQGNKEPVPNLDLMGQLVSKGTCEVDMEGPKGKSKTKDQFLEASLIIPAIALKKFQQSALEQTSRLGSFLAILGVDEVKMYKTTRPKLAAICAGDVLSDPSFFWQHASSQLKARKAKAIFLFTQFAGDLDSVSQLSGCTHTHCNMHPAYCALHCVCVVGDEGCAIMEVCSAFAL